jgi:hypothetical protein
MYDFAYDIMGLKLSISWNWNYHDDIRVIVDFSEFWYHTDIIANIICKIIYNIMESKLWYHRSKSMISATPDIIIGLSSGIPRNVLWLVYDRHIPVIWQSEPDLAIWQVYASHMTCHKKNPFIDVFYHQSSERHPGHTTRAQPLSRGGRVRTGDQTTASPMPWPLGHDIWLSYTCHITG